MPFSYTRQKSMVPFESPSTVVILTKGGEGELVSMKYLPFLNPFCYDSLFITFCFASRCTNDFILVVGPNVS